MEAASRGASQAGGTVVAVLPGTDRAAGNRFSDVTIATGLGHARNLAVVASADVVVAVGGQWGTLSEIGLAGVVGRPVVLLAGWRLEHAGQLPGEVSYAETAAERRSSLPSGWLTPRWTFVPCRECERFNTSRRRRQQERCLARPLAHSWAWLPCSWPLLLRSPKPVAQAVA